ncbi:HTH-type transcriptional activator RhaR [anaerobic digester metagenome]
MEENLKKLNETLSAFCTCTNVPVTVYTPSGETILDYLPELKFCSIFNAPDGKLNKKCIDTLSFSAQFSANLGEPYIFTCPANFINIAIPVIIDKKHFVSVIIGPLVMGNFNEIYLDKVFELYPDSQPLLPKISLAISKLIVYNSTHIQSLSTLLFNHLIGTFKNWHDYEHLNARYQSQLYIGDQIKKYKNRSAAIDEDVSTLTALEHKLIRFVEERNKDKAHDILTLYYDEILIIEGGNFDNIKGRIFELFGTLSQQALDSGASIQKIFSLDFNKVFAMSQVQNVTELFNWIVYLIHHFIDNVYNSLILVQSKIIKQALIFINDSYCEKITLNDLAAHLHMSKAYLSKLFNQEVGVNFTTYLNDKRIQKSLEYLEDKDMNLADIALQVGFEDQSYFTKVFKKLLGETPKEYRKRITAQQQ